MRSTCRPSPRSAGHVPVDKRVILLACESSSPPKRAPAGGHFSSWVAGLVAPLLLVWTAWASQASAQTRVDLELVIAVDVSLSMDLDEQQLQRDGYVAAFRDSDLHKAIASGPYGRIAVTYMEWAGPGVQTVIIPWTLIDSPAAARAFAARLASQPITRERLTSISAALQFAQGLLKDTGFSASRQVIDVSGDGPNNQGGPVTSYRDRAVAAGITINGLPIVNDRAGPWGWPAMSNSMART